MAAFIMQASTLCAAQGLGYRVGVRTFGCRYGFRVQGAGCGVLQPLNPTP